MICQHCNANTVKTYGSSVCSLKCATEAMGEDYKLVRFRIYYEILTSKLSAKAGKRSKHAT